MKRRASSHKCTPNRTGIQSVINVPYESLPHETPPNDEAVGQTLRNDHTTTHVDQHLNVEAHHRNEAATGIQDDVMLMRLVVIGALWIRSYMLPTGVRTRFGQGHPIRREPM